MYIWHNFFSNVQHWPLITPISICYSPALNICTCATLGLIAKINVHIYLWQTCLYCICSFVVLVYDRLEV